MGLLAVLAIGTAVSLRLVNTETKGEDVYYSWVEGQRLLNGENPYGRVLFGNMRDNLKYATYFPIFYELSYLSQRAGLRDYPEWIVFWRIVFLGFNLGTACVLFYECYRRRLLLLGVFGAAFWLLNRWTLHIVQVADLDFMAIFFLLLSLALFERHRLISILLFGLSLGIKHIGIFLVPLYLVWVWQATTKDPLRQAAVAALAMASIPLLASVPFIAWDPKAFFVSVIFDALRNPADHFGASSVDAMLGWVGLPAKVPMVALMVLVFLLAWRRQVAKYTSVMLVMATFVNFSSLLFKVYLAWLALFIPLVLCDLADARTAKIDER